MSCAFLMEVLKLILDVMEKRGNLEGHKPFNDQQAV